MKPEDAAAAFWVLVHGATLALVFYTGWNIEEIAKELKRRGR